MPINHIEQSTDLPPHLLPDCLCCLVRQFLGSLCDLLRRPLLCGAVSCNWSEGSLPSGFLQILDLGLLIVQLSLDLPEGLPTGLLRILDLDLLIVQLSLDLPEGLLEFEYSANELFGGESCKFRA